MKKLFGIITVLTIGIATVYAVTIPATGGYWGKPSNTAVITLDTSKAGNTTTDSIAAGAAITYGPYNLSVDPSRTGFKSLRAYVPKNALASGDSLQLGYQLLAGGSASDTGTTWSVIDTLIDAKRSSAVDISSLPGVSIMFRILNIDASKVGQKKKIKIVFLAPSTDYVDTKK